MPFLRTALSSSFALAMLCGAVGPAWGHAKVVHAEPAEGAVLAKPPGEVRLEFDEAIEPAFTTLQLRDMAGKPAVASPAGAVEVTGHTAAMPIPATLGPGHYKVHWATVGPDGHRVQGDVHFVVK